MNPHLFVYGSLLSTAGHPSGARLRAEATLLGAASTPGRLYRVGWYPGLLGDTAGSARVHGEVYALTDPVRSLVWLDAYESIVPGNEADNEYIRVERPVQLATGYDLVAWVYLYQRDVTGLELVADGRWIGAAP